MLYLFLLISLFTLFIIKKVSQKEYLEILEYENRLYFLLSGDEYVVIKIDKNSRDELIEKVINKYKKELNKIVESIKLVNIDNASLEYKLNRMIGN